MSGADDRVAVVVVNWNAGPLLRDCLVALARQTHAARRVILVDNASSDGSLAAAQPFAASVELVRLDANTGFAAAVNTGLARCRDEEWVAVLNPDAFPEPDWLAQLLAAGRRQPDTAVVASRQLVAERPDLLDGAGDVYAVSGLAWRRGHGRSAAGRHTALEEVFAACAAAALYRRAAVVEAGGFDASFFCYYEDVDLAFRLRLLGHRCLYAPAAVVRHVGSATTGRHSDFAVYHGHRNLVWTWLKNMPAPLLALYLPAHLALTAVSLAWLSLRGQGGVVLRAKRDALRDLPRVLGERRALQRRRRVGAWALRRQMAGGWKALGVGRHT